MRACSRTASGSSSCTASTSTTERWSRWTRGPATSSPTSAAPATTATTWHPPSSIRKFDVAGYGYRQPGSAWKPILYSAGFDAGKITPGTLLPDVVTEFSRGWFPKDADNRERGPVLMRQALSYSLNIPTIRALDMIGVDTVAQEAQKMGLTFARGPNQLIAGGAGGGDRDRRDEHGRNSPTRMPRWPTAVSKSGRAPSCRSPTATAIRYPLPARARPSRLSASRPRG